jgi:hypothetical protein
MYIYPLSFMLLGCVVIHPERPSPEDKQMGWSYLGFPASKL